MRYRLGVVYCNSADIVIGVPCQSYKPPAPDEFVLPIKGTYSPKHRALSAVRAEVSR